MHSFSAPIWWQGFVRWSAVEGPRLTIGECSVALALNAGWHGLVAGWHGLVRARHKLAALGENVMNKVCLSCKCHI